MSENTNKEHETYLRIMEEYENAKRKRLVYRRKGAAFIIISGIIFLTLMFSLESKIEFLVLWVASDFFCAALMIKADYHYHKFTEYLGIEDEYSNYTESEESE